MQGVQIKKKFETERLIVRLYTDADRDNHFALMGDPAVMQYIRAVKNKEESDAFLAEVITHSHKFPTMGRWAVEEKKSGKFVGSFAIIPVTGEEEKIQLGYSLLPHCWGKGYATELTKSGLIYFFKHNSYAEIYAHTEIPNVASQKVLMKAGFHQAGTKMEEGKELIRFIFKRKK